MRQLMLIAALLCLVACSSPDKKAESDSAESTADEKDIALPDSGEIAMQNIDLYLHDTAPTAGASRKPAFWVHAGQFSMLENGIWNFQHGRAVVYGDSADEENIILEAEKGTFEEGKGALMEGGVKATAGTMAISLDEIIWKNPTPEERGVAYSENELSIEDTDLMLTAGSIRLYPKEKTFELTRVAGSIYVGSISQ